MSSGSLRARLLLKRVQNIWTRGTSPRVRFLMSHSKEPREKIGYKTENVKNIWIRDMSPHERLLMSLQISQVKLPTHKLFLQTQQILAFSSSYFRDV